MARVVAGMTLSLDGFVADEQGSNERLYPDLEAIQETSYMRDMQARTGAVLMGRTTFAMSEDPDWYADNYEFQCPIFVVTHNPPSKQPRETDRISFTFVSDGVESAVRQAKAAAGDKEVTVVGGASLIRQLVQARLVDELSIDFMPVLLGAGLRLFDGRGFEDLELEKVKLEEIGQRTSLFLRVRK